MSRGSLPAPASGPATEPRRAAAVRPWVRAALPVGALAIGVLATYLAHPIFRGHGLPLGPDGPVYVWWARFADAVGLDGVRRPGVPGLTLLLGEALGRHPLHVVASLGPVLAAASGLAAAALVETTLGHRPVRTWTAGALVAAYAGFLAPGWLANLALGAAFLGAAAALALAERTWRAVGVAAALLAAGGVAHLPFLFVALVILAGTALGLLPSAMRRLRQGTPLSATAAFRISAGALAGGAAALLGMAALAGGPRAPGDTSQDEFFRRRGLRVFLRDRFRERFAREAVRMAPALLAGGALAVRAGAELRPGGRGAGGRDPEAAHASPHAEGPRYLGALALSWAIVTVVGVGVLWLTVEGPASRMLAFAFVLPIVAALGLSSALGSPHRWWRAGAVLAALVLAAGSLWGWLRQHPYAEEAELAVVGRAGAAISRLPPRTPVVFLTDTEELAAGFHVARFGNVIRAGLPPGRIGQAHIAIGAPSDHLARRPGDTSDDPEYAELAAAYRDEIEPVLDRAVVLVLGPFNEPGWEEARAAGREVAPGVVQLEGPAIPSAASSSEAPGRHAPPTAGLAGPALVGVTVGALALLTLLGAGWARWALRAAGRRAGLAAAPSAGLGLAILASVAADRFGLPAGGGGLAISAVLAGLGYLLALRPAEEPVHAPEEPRP